MAIATEQTAERFLNIIVNTPLNNGYPLFSEDDVEVIYGFAALEAVLNVDYTVQLDTVNYDEFTITPLASLLTKINNLIAADPTNEINYVTVRRKLNNLTPVTPELARGTSFLSREIEKIAMRFMGLQEQIKRCVQLSSAFVGDTQLIIGEAIADTVLKWSPDGTRIESGPSVTQIEAVIPNAAAAAASASAASSSASAASAFNTSAEAAAAEAAADALQIAEILDSLVLGPAQPKRQIFTSGVANAASLTITQTPIPVQEEAFNVLLFTTATGTNKGTLLPSDTYSYNNTTGVVSFSPSLPADATKVEIKWFTSLNVGSVSDKSINWLTKMVDSTANTIAAFDATGASILRSFVTTLTGATDILIPSAKAVKDYIDAAVAGIPAAIYTAIGLSKYAESGEYSLAAEGTINTWTHAMGLSPKDVRLFLRCKTNDSGWTAGDEVELAPSHFNGSNNYAGYSIGWNGTTVKLIQGLERTIRNGTTGAAVSSVVTPANWRFFMRAWG